LPNTCGAGPTVFKTSLLMFIIRGAAQYDPPTSLLTVTAHGLYAIAVHTVKV
jgi:hypothetical protein